MERREGQADAVIVGSALGGLVAGAILARHGKRVVVLEHADTVGGRGGSVPRDGYWIDFGHRDGHDVGDCQVAWHHGVEAAREAGVEVTLRRVTSPLRVHHLPAGEVTTGGDWSAAGLLAMACAALAPGKEDAEELRALVDRLAGAEPAEMTAAVPATLDAWLAAHTASAAVRRAVLLMAAVVFHSHPEEASAGRFMQFLRRRSAGGPCIPDDDEVGGMQGLIEPWARAIRAAGGEIALGWKPVEIVVEGGGVRGAVAVDRTNLVREVRAPVAISTYPVWENFELIDERLFPADLVAAAWQLRAHRADLVGWQAGLRRLPALRLTGQPDDHAGWNRLLAGPERTYRGGYQITSLTSRRAAPPGRHLLALVMARFYRGGSTAGQPWTAARAVLDEAIAYLHHFYADLDACLEWSAYQYVTAPQSMSWAWAPIVRHGLEVAGIDGLYLASSTLEAPAAVLDIGAYAGRETARRALAR
ncbi:MAG: hypothetical protein E6J79_17920 [Deltaproteobacteria bacterium]|nr:MAG: hypothetical protein E6J79_17920 [Deltaproteobacteria bacterium]